MIVQDSSYCSPHSDEELSLYVSGIAISEKKDHCVLFSDSEWSTTKSAWKSTIPFSLLHPQCTMGYDKFLPAPNC